MKTDKADSGVDAEREYIALKRLMQRVRKTWPSGKGRGSVKLDIGYFANVVDLGGVGLAIAADGVGTKVLVAQMMDKYDTVGIDCVAMNVNDLICVGARPITLVDYLALQEPDPDMVDQISKGLCEGAAAADVSITGGEISQIGEIVIGCKEGRGFDLAAMAVGTVDLGRIITGSDIQDGDVIIGIHSNGIHSNGLTLARRILFDRKGYSVATSLPQLDRSLGDELLRPTHIYVREVMDMLDHGLNIKALMHITGDGFLNLTRVDSDVSFVIEDLPPVPAIFGLIQEGGEVTDEEMFKAYNMGIGFCIVVSPDQAETVVSIVNGHGKKAHKIGHTSSDKGKSVYIEPAGLVGHDGRFVKYTGSKSS